MGVSKDITRAIEMYSSAASLFGHFDSIKALGGIYLEVTCCLN